MPAVGRKRKAATTQLNHEDVASWSLTSRCVKQSRYISSRDVQDLSLIETPYGRLTKSFDVRVVSGEPLAIMYCCPFAWLYIVCLKCERMLHFLRAVLQGSPGNVVAYVDATTPGNCLRPDKGRSVNSIFWSIAEFPDWFRVRRCNWWLFANIPETDMHRIEGGSSEVMSKFMDVFWSLEGFNFERLGIKIQNRLVKLQYGFMILDEKAEKEIFGVRGAGATRMCLSCCNVIKTTRPIPAGSPLVPFTEPDRSKWEPNSKELIKAAVDYLDTQRLVLGPNPSETLQKQVGMTHKDCVLVRSRFWGTLDLPQKRYTDWFHD